MQIWVPECRNRVYKGPLPPFFRGFTLIRNQNLILSIMDLYQKMEDGKFEMWTRGGGWGLIKIGWGWKMKFNWIHQFLSYVGEQWLNFWLGWIKRWNRWNIERMEEGGGGSLKLIHICFIVRIKIKSWKIW